MAMVYLSNRNVFNLNDSKNSYNNSISEIINNISKSIVVSPNNKINKFRPPFNTSGAQHKNVILSNNYNVGPGSYNNVFSLKVRPSASSFENLNFNSSCPRFNYKEKSISPGPCAYYKEEKFKKNPKENSMLKAVLKANEKLKEQNYNKSSISSIPTKDQQFGYYEDTNGELIPAPMPEIPERSTTSSGTIAWGKPSKIFENFEESSTSCSRHSVNSSKMSKKEFCPDLSIICSNNNNSFNIDSYLPESKPLKNLREKIQKYRANLYNSYNKKFDDTYEKWIKEIDLYINGNTKTTFKETNDRLWNKDIDNKKRQLYIEENNKNINVPEELQFFGSSVARLNYSFDKGNPNVGPGSYFNSTTVPKKNYLRSNSNKSILKKKINNEQKISKKDEEKLKGPMFYDISKSFLKKSYNKYGNFSMCKRFKNENKINWLINPTTPEISPGPGSYDVHDPWKAKNKIYPTNINVNVNLLSKLIKKSNMEKNIEKENYKDIGNNFSHINNKNINDKNDYNFNQSYEYPNSIQERIKKKYNEFQSKNIPFGNKEERFVRNGIDNKNNNRVGPGSYDKYKYEEDKKRNTGGMCIPFNYKDTKRTNYVNKSNVIGPGEYVTESYFDWNKKSFNKMFA